MTVEKYKLSRRLHISLILFVIKCTVQNEVKKREMGPMESTANEQAKT